MTEESIFKHRLTDRADIERNERPLPSTCAVQRSRDEFLTRPGGAFYEHRKVRWSGHPDHSPELDDGCRVADEPGVG
jgi:hypothetical protein